jgi:dienelactone hydrolase
MLCVAVLAIAVLHRPVQTHIAAATLLGSFASTDAFDDVGTRDVVLDTPEGPRRARIFKKRDARTDAPGVVLVHGVHWKSIDEERLNRFAKAIARTGTVVMTPEVRELAEYRVTTRSVDTLHTATRALATELGHARVGLVGLSFGGGLALLDASADDHVAFVLGVGAYDDLYRVTSFFLTGKTADPDGRAAPVVPHDYGPMVFAYENADAIFAAIDVEPARDAMRAWLHEDRDRARSLAEGLSTQGRTTIDSLFDANYDSVRSALEARLEARHAEMDRVSPSRLHAALAVPVYLVHGSSDTVIPATETRWLAHDVHATRVVTLVSPALGHVDLGKGPTYQEQWDLVHFMASVLGEAS